ncbi:MAG: T9SS type A sorting domain-containing protein [Bacteroidia bacterium]|nr:T9SS type A sorting domain-containing protein [Bacteroidia bacterium]
MRCCFRTFGLMLAVLLWTSTAMGQAPQPGYVPPDPAEHGLLAHNQHLAVIQTNCATMDEAVALRNELVRNGALVSLFTSPQFMLAWVPPDAKSAVLSTKASSALGSIGVVGVSYSSAEFRAQLGANHTMAALNEADEAILEYIDFIKQPLTEEDKERIRKAEEEMAARSGTMPPMDCVRDVTVNEPSPRELHKGIPALGIDDPQIMHASKIRGFVVHTSFFVESKSGTGTWNWDNTIYTRYRNFYVAGMNYWASFTARYGRTLTTLWRLYSSSSSYTQVTGEPTTTGEDVFIPEVVKKFYTPSGSNKPPVWDWAGAGLEYCWWYNQKIRDVYNSDDAVCGFIAYKPTSGEAIWPHAVSVIWGGVEREGVYFTLDTQYWQCELDPFSKPLRNVIAHELGHLWGSPDEYKSDNCSWSYRSMPNVNCQNTRPAYGRPGYNMRGWDGIMVENYTGGNSSATPVHTGVIPVGEAVPTRLFLSTPSGATISFRNCDNIRNVDRTTPIAVPMDFDYCHRLVAPASRNVSGTTWYFDYWEITRKSGATTTIDYYANELPSFAYTSTFANPVRDVRAVYTNSPPDIFTVNTTLSAELAPAGTSASPNPGIALRWRNKYNMSETQTSIEYEASAGNWRPLTAGQHMVLGPFHVPVNQWTGVLIYAVPGTGGTGANAIQSNREYRFRIVGYFNTNRGAYSVIKSVTTRPAAPADTVYCYDPSEPNTISSPKVLTSSGPGMTPYSVRGAIPVTGIAGEFSWFIPISDYYRLTAINLSGGLFGEVVRLKLRVRSGSDFEPNFRAQRAGSATHINSVKSGNTWTLTLNTDGEYLIKVEPKISQTISYDLVDRTGGHFAFGEYDFSVERDVNEPSIVMPCFNCVKVKFVHPYPGEIVLTPHPKFNLFRSGVDRNPPTQFAMRYVAPPGFNFLGFGGSFGNLPGNPTPMNIGPNTQPGEYHVYPIIEPIDERTAELVVIHPEGPGEPLDHRQSAPIGGTLVAEAKAPDGFLFVAWGGDTTATTNPLNVVMWKSKKLIAHYREKPCVPEPMTAWRHTLAFVNSRSTQVTLDYAMQNGAGDGLEAGQVDLPPVPPPTAFDIRFINIVGSQGSVTDHRAVKPSHTFQGRVQTGPTQPVEMTWPAPPVSPNASFTLRIQGMPGSIDMRTQSSYTFADEGTYIFTIEVKESSCPQPTKENEVIITTKGVDTRDWPCIRLALELRSRSTGELLPYYNPYKLRFGEKMGDGSVKPMQGTTFTQLDSLLIVNICADPVKPGRDRDIEIVNDNDEDPDEDKDTVRVRIPVPIPPGTGDPVRFAWKIPGDWQMVSLPLNSTAANVGTMFNDPTLRMYHFNTTTGVYDVALNMEFGKGYWVKSNGLDGIVYGLEQLTLELDDLNGIGEPSGFGWNMAGAPSKGLTVASIQSAPAGGLKAIFGWNPASGYVIPTNIEPGKGYWVRVDPNTKLTMQGSAVTGGGVTAYSKTVDKLDIAGMLNLSVDGEGNRPLYVSGTTLRTDERDNLALPAVPPAQVFDVRTAEQTQYLFPGDNSVRIRANGSVVIGIPADMPRVTVDVLTEEGTSLGRLTGSAGERLTVNIDGSGEVLMRISVRPLAGEDALGINYPNPFQVATESWIPYTLSHDGEVRLAIFDLLGRHVRTLVSSTQLAGEKLVSWNGRDANGDAVPAGMYVYRLETAAGVVTRTLTIVK